jgi:endonuclease YncB( thermonuclease family)
MRAVVIAVCALGCWLFAAPAALAATGPCGVGANSPTCHITSGKVTFIGDGDTVSVKLDGRPKDAPVRVRITGIQAMEEHVYTTDARARVGECHANEATARLEYLVALSHGRVQLAALDKTAHSGSRERRQVRVYINGTWRDVGRMLINEGHALWLPNPVEWAFNGSYNVLSQRAADRQVGLWNSYYCGPGPEDLASLRVWVNSNPYGSDRRDPNGEWVRIKNLNPVNPVALGGWWVRDSALRRYTLPSSAVVPAGGTITVYVGKGADTATDYYWGLRGGVFDNVTHDGHNGGDGAFLFDTEGDLRAWMIYPCRVTCTDPLQKALKLTTHPTGTEYVDIENVTATPVNLEGYRLAISTQGYAFPSGTILQPGDVLRVTVKGDPETDTALEKHWGLTDLILPNDGGELRAATFDGIVLACDAWGTGSCS